MAPRSSKRKQKIDLRQDDGLYSPIDNLKKVSESIKQEFEAASLDHMREILDVISHSGDLKLEERVQLLKTVRQLTTKALHDIMPPIPEIAPALWKERGKENYHMSPCDFVKKHYPSLGFGLTQAHLGRLDPPLLPALRNWRDKYGWPDNFDLPSENEYNDRLFDEMSEHEVQETTRLGQVAVSRLKRNKM